VDQPEHRKQRYADQQRAEHGRTAAQRHRRPLHLAAAIGPVHKAVFNRKPPHPRCQKQGCDQGDCERRHKSDDEGDHRGGRFDLEVGSGRGRRHNQGCKLIFPAASLPLARFCGSIVRCLVWPSEATARRDRSSVPVIDWLIRTVSYRKNPLRSTTSDARQSRREKKRLVPPNNPRTGPPQVLVRAADPGPRLRFIKTSNSCPVNVSPPDVPFIPIVRSDGGRMNQDCVLARSLDGLWPKPTMSGPYQELLTTGDWLRAGERRPALRAPIARCLSPFVRAFKNCRG